MILITTNGKCAVDTPDRGRKVCGAGEIILGTPECEAFLIQRGVAEAVDSQDYGQLMEDAEQANAAISAYGKMTVAQLKEELTKKRIVFSDKAKKDELLTLLIESVET